MVVKGDRPMKGQVCYDIIQESVTFIHKMNICMAETKSVEIFSRQYASLSLESLPAFSDLPPTTNKTFVFKKATLPPTHCGGEDIGLCLR